MFRKFVLPTLFALALTNIISVRTEASVKLIVMFDQGVCVLPAPPDSLHALETVTLPNDIFDALEAGGVSSVANVFPEFSVTDTLVTMRSGESVRVSDLSRVFYLDCPTEEQATSLISALETLPGVVYIARPDEPIKLACDYNVVTDAERQLLFPANDN